MCSDTDGIDGPWVVWCKKKLPLSFKKMTRGWLCAEQAVFFWLKPIPHIRVKIREEGNEMVE